MEADRFRELCEGFLLSGLEGQELRAFRDELQRRGAEGREILHRTREAVALLAYELPILTAESVYQLWAIRDGEPFSVGTFMARDEGPARLDLDSLDPVEGADLLAVTIEPAPGQPAPTGGMVLISGEQGARSPIRPPTSEEDHGGS